MDRFSKFNPLISFSFFMGVIALSIVFTNSFSIVFSFLFAFCYYFKLSGKNALKMLVKFVFPVVIFAGIFNMFFAHYGKTVIFGVKEINFTLECLIAGLFTGLMIGAVIMWFFCYNEVVTSEKFLAVFGSAVPNLALLLSMIFRFVPLMVKTADEIKDAQKGIGADEKGLKNAAARFFSLISISLEKSLETADSMKARGFGSKKRRFYSSYRFRVSDGFAAVFIILCLVYLFVAGVKTYPQIVFSPALAVKKADWLFLIVFSAYSIFPLLTDLTEDIKWLLLKSKI